MVLSYGVASLWECLAHAKILHASKAQRQQFKKLGWFGYLLRRAYLSHELIHHRATFQDSFYQQFANDSQQKQLDKRLRQYLGDELTSKIQQNHYGLTVNHFWEMVVFLFIPLLVNATLFFMLDIWLGLETWLILVVVVISALPVLMSKFVHPWLHRDYGYVQDKPRLIRWCYQPLLFLQRYHYLHHTHRYCNFNLCLGADWVLGYYS